MVALLPMLPCHRARLVRSGTDTLDCGQRHVVGAHGAFAGANLSRSFDALQTNASSSTRPAGIDGLK